MRSFLVFDCVWWQWFTRTLNFWYLKKVSLNWILSKAVVKQNQYQIKTILDSPPFLIQHSNPARTYLHSTTPITAMGCRQCLPLSVVQLKGKHCRKPHCQGCLKKQNYPLRLSALKFSQNWIKFENFRNHKKCQKMMVFGRFFKVSWFWVQF